MSDKAPRVWPGNQVDIQRFLQEHDELCDILEERGYSEADINTASVGMWGAFKIMGDKYDAEKKRADELEQVIESWKREEQINIDAVKEYKGRIAQLESALTVAKGALEKIGNAMYADHQCEVVSHCVGIADGALAEIEAILNEKGEK